MKAFFDASAMAKRYIAEPGSEQVEAILHQATSLGVSVIIVPEIVSALNRRTREKLLTTPDYALIKQQLVEDVTDAEMIQLSSPVLARSIKLLEQHQLRGMDSLHIACAIEWKADIFVSSDRRQLAAAGEEGLAVKEV